MRKFILSVAIISATTFIGCGSSNSNEFEGKIKDLESEITSLKNEIKAKDELIQSLQGIDTEEKNEDESSDYLSAGEVFTVDSELGKYEFKILEANYIAPRNDDPKSFAQIVWEVNNISFSGREEDFNGKVLDEGFCQVGEDSIKVKDDNNYILESAGSSYEGESSNQYEKVYIGEKVKQKYIWILDEDDTEYVYVSFPRMKNEEYKIKLNR